MADTLTPNILESNIPSIDSSEGTGLPLRKGGIEQGLQVEHLKRILTERHFVNFNPTLFPVHFSSNDTENKTTINVMETQDVAHGMFVRGGSAHNVTTAYLDVHDGSSLQSVVVLKRHVKPVKAQQEFARQKEVHQRGFITTVPVMTIVSREQREAFVLTLFDEDIRSADRINWQMVSKREKTEFLNKFAVLTAQLHAAGIYHFDTQLKNICLRRSNGMMFLFDFERSQIFKKPIPVDQDTHNVIMSIRPFLNSLRSLNFWEQITPGREIEYVRSDFIKPYLTELKKTHTEEQVSNTQMAIERAIANGTIWNAKPSNVKVQ